MKKITILIMLLLSMAGCTHEEQKTMAIETDGTGTKYIKWTQPAGVVGLTQKSLLMWIYPTNNNAPYEVFLIYDGTGTDADELSSYQINTGSIQLTAHWSTTNGIWYATSALLTINAWNHIAVTYDGSSTANNPVMYLNGASVAVTRATAPAGTYRTGTAADVYLGTDLAGANLPGKVASVLYYNRILGASEIQDAYASRKFIPSWNGLVFAPMLAGAAGGVGDGSTLAAGNTIADQVSGALGVPSGSPILRGDTYLTFDQ